MRRSSARSWSELRKEMSRSSNLVWLVSLLLWLALSSSRYSHWHSLSYRLLRHKWLSAIHTDHQLHYPLAQSMPSSSLASSSSPHSLHHLNYTHADTDSTKKSASISDPHHGFNVRIEADDDNDIDAHYIPVLHPEHGLITPDESAHGSHQEDDFYKTKTLDVDGHNSHDSDLNEKENLDRVDSRWTETLKEQMHHRASYDAQNDKARIDHPKTCASVEEMGFVAAGNVIDASLRVRKMINDYLSKHGASYVRNLPAEKFCRRGFIFGRAAEDGLGNDIYKILTASGLSIMLNRSLIIAEHGSTNPAHFGLTGRIRLPFGEYLRYSNQTFSLSEVKRLWVKHDCAGVFQRPLTMIIDDFQRPTRTKVFCEDWTRWRHPIIWFKGTTDSNALQFFLKNQHRVMRESAISLFGNPANPSSRPNVFGELFKAFISPMPVIEEAVHWVLQGLPDPDISVHMRMLNSRSRAAPYAVCSCIQTVVRNVLQNKRLPQIVIVSDTPFIIKHVKEKLEGFAQVVYFDYKLFMDKHHNLTKVMTGNYFQPPEKRIRDWGSMPRWVAIVDLFLAARAKSAVISGANRRVGTTYAQLLASLAAAIRTDEQAEIPSGFGFFSSFQPSLLAEGLAGQRGWGHTWRRFAGRRSCKNQTRQCAQTPLLPYAWWDGPWQSPAPRDAQRMLAYGIKLSDSGQVEAGLAKTCLSRKAPLETVQLMLPSCKRLKLCPR